MTCCLEGSCSIQLSYRSVYEFSSISEAQNKGKNASSSNELPFSFPSAKTALLCGKGLLS
jgi:hypothetical protein